MMILKFLNFQILVVKNLTVFLQMDLDEKILENKKLVHHKFLLLHYHKLVVVYLDRV